MAQPPLEVDQQRNRDIFSDKVVMTKENQYSGHKNANGGEWRKWAKRYFVGRAYDIGPIIDYVENHEDDLSFTKDIQLYFGQYYLHARVAALSRELWNFLICTTR